MFRPLLLMGTWSNGPQLASSIVVKRSSLKRTCSKVFDACGEFMRNHKSACCQCTKTAELRSPELRWELQESHFYFALLSGEAWNDSLINPRLVESCHWMEAEAGGVDGDGRLASLILRHVISDWSDRCCLSIDSIDRERNKARSGTHILAFVMVPGRHFAMSSLRTLSLLLLTTCTLLRFPFTSSTFKVGLHAT